MQPKKIAERIWPDRELVLEPLAGGSPTRTSSSRWTARSPFSGSAARIRSCLPSIVPSSTAPRSSPRSWGSVPRSSATSSPRAYLVTRFIEGRPIPPEEMRRAETIARAAAVLRRLHDGPRSRKLRLVSRRRGVCRTAAPHGVEVPEVFEWAHGVSALRIEAARHRARRRSPAATTTRTSTSSTMTEHPHRRLGVRRHRQPLLRPRQLLHQPRVRRRGQRLAPRGLLRRAPGRGRAGLPAHALHVRLPRGHVGVVQQGVSDLDVDYVAWASQHFDRMLRTSAEPAFQQALDAEEEEQTSGARGDEEPGTLLGSSKSPLSARWTGADRSPRSSACRRGRPVRRPRVTAIVPPSATRRARGR